MVDIYVVKDTLKLVRFNNSSIANIMKIIYIFFLKVIFYLLNEQTLKGQTSSNF